MILHLVYSLLFAGKDSSERMSAGQMLLAGFNGLFTKVESELDAMVSALSEVNSSSCDVVQDAKKLQVTWLTL
jgi:hypothetical protein